MNYDSIKLLQLRVVYMCLKSKKKYLQKKAESKDMLKQMKIHAI